MQPDNKYSGIRKQSSHWETRIRYKDKLYSMGFYASVEAAALAWDITAASLRRCRKLNFPEVSFTDLEQQLDALKCVISQIPGNEQIAHMPYPNPMYGAADMANGFGAGGIGEEVKEGDNAMDIDGAPPPEHAMDGSAVAPPPADGEAPPAAADGAPAPTAHAPFDPSQIGVPVPVPDAGLEQEMQGMASVVPTGAQGVAPTPAPPGDTDEGEGAGTMAGVQGMVPPPADAAPPAVATAEPGIDAHIAQEPEAVAEGVPAAPQQVEAGQVATEPVTGLPTAGAVADADAEQGVIEQGVPPVATSQEAAPMIDAPEAAPEAEVPAAVPAEAATGGAEAAVAEAAPEQAVAEAAVGHADADAALLEDAQAGVAMAEAARSAQAQQAAHSFQAALLAAAVQAEHVANGGADASGAVPPAPDAAP